MKKKLKRVSQFIFVLVICLLFSACNQGNGTINDSDDKKVYGGEILRYSLCLEENASQIVSCPIITSKEAKTISLNNYVSNQKEEISVSVSSIDLNESVAYKGYYIYFAILTIKCNTYEKAVNASIEKLLFDIDNEIMEYNTPYFNIKNTCYYTENNIFLAEDNHIKISGDFTGLYNNIPNESNKADLSITSSEDIVLKSYSLIDYLKVESMEIDKEPFDSSELNFELKKSEEISFEYILSVNEHVNEDNIIRVSQIIVYEYEGKDYLWVYTSGIYVWKNYSNYGNIKRYIDTF